MNKSLGLDALKNHLFETLEGVKNLSDKEASDNEKISLEQAKSIVDIADSIIDIYKVQVNAMQVMNDIGNAPVLMADMGVIDSDTTKLIQ